ncbi:MAG: MlaD family protein [Coraliomargarita sp.]
MNHKPSAAVIGGFVTVGVALLIALTMYFGASSFSKNTTKYILFFDQTVNGLEVGAPVKYRGVPIGFVDQILMQAVGQRPNSAAIPVIIAVDSDLTEARIMEGATYEETTIHELIEMGFVAKLSLQSMITGQLFVELNYDTSGRHRDYVSCLVAADASDFVEIPTVNSSLDEIATDMAEVVSKIAEWDFEQFDDNVNSLLVNVNEAVVNYNEADVSQALAQLAADASTFIQSGEMEKTMSELRKMIRDTSEVVQTYDLTEGPLGEELVHVNERFDQTMNRVDAILDNASVYLEPDSNLIYGLETSLRELSRTAQSLRILVEYLERNPNALLAGRKSGTKD